MLNSYQDQIHSNPTEQALLEQSFTNILSTQFSANLDAFSLYCPNILKQLSGYKVNQYKIFCTKRNQPNIVDLNTGQAIYSIDPKTEIISEVQQFREAAVYIDLSESTDVKKIYWPTKNLSDSSTVILFGLGLGYQIELLLKQNPPSVLVIYEPELDFFYSAMQVIDWLSIYQLAEKHGTLISIQLGSDGNNVESVIADLIQYKLGLKELFIYRHIAHPVMDEVINFLIESVIDARQLGVKKTVFTGLHGAENYLPTRAENILGNAELSTEVCKETKLKFKQNIAAFKQHYPSLVNLIANYQPKQWFFVNHKKRPNLWHKKRNLFLYKDCLLDAEKTVANFFSKAHQDNFLIGKNVVWKFSHYVHYKSINKLQSVFNQMATMQQYQVNELNSLIIFGIGCGQHISKINQNFSVKQLYIFEPNVDFFYASLFSFDWQQFFDTATKQEQQIYLNIGGSETDYFADIMQQFYQAGAHTIADTKMLQAYENPFLTRDIELLKHQLKVILAMGDYYDEARFGISHTYTNFKTGFNWLKADRALYSHHPTTETPVFIVGNGPSLDDSIEYLKEHRHNAIVISCGTALKALYKLGIKPDFHTEAEQNRSSYRWITQIKDQAYLKGIYALSINGLHPDSAALFADAFLAFKDGEAAAYIFKQLLPNTVDIASIPFAYPTVSNLAISFALHAGFKQLYLFGVDLGYIDADNHHSKHSAYYNQDGKAIYDYKKVHGEGITVEGNFRPTVQTKVEFDVSRQIMEKTIAAYGAQVEVYNCSDGAKVKGAVSLQPANILITECNGHVQENLQHFLTTAFYQESFFPQTGQLLTVFNINQVRTSIEQWCDLISTEITDSTAAKQQVEQQWQLFKQLSAEQGSFLFPLLHGSTTYILGLLTKLISFMTDKENLLEALKQYNYVVSVWHDYLQAVVDDFCNEPLKLDETK
ncbi:6-hydroxymethylpterin diphosphokinase MptE-like protein [Rheinheimera sp. MMS21-TC3]|uniref:6-hydroxymethylpterin diphosphokinase MptE-like protein n=1 Tax=Rheinheimera sp. MMS21-TC3 TaxID=3072790 RepID=UPI0028C3D358|nr:6-hydroxymethylpterin diphosphokinase MptE-like protein [Rheinheimera sp. MMS21-TC3]WNO61821.1 6-hydroxymethylpterin diphosphokinase MptE-like protein [Rheinheimera sp. MMS21-TC3]